MAAASGELLFAQEADVEELLLPMDGANSWRRANLTGWSRSTVSQSEMVAGL
jgi:hypothetical protein